MFPDIGKRLGPGLVSWEIYEKNLKGSVVDTKGVLKDVRLNYLWGANSPWNCAWGAKVFDELVKRPSVEGAQRREVTIERLEGIHHFVSFFSTYFEEPFWAAIWVSMLTILPVPFRIRFLGTS